MHGKAHVVRAANKSRTISEPYTGHTTMTQIRMRSTTIVFRAVSFSSSVACTIQYLVLQQNFEVYWLHRNVCIQLSPPRLLLDHKNPSRRFYYYFDLGLHDIVYPHESKDLTKYFVIKSAHSKCRGIVSIAGATTASL